MSANTLYDLYEKNIGLMSNVEAKCNADMYGPFLLSPNESYINSRLKVAFVGQETHYWDSGFNVSEQMQRYSKFNLGETYAYKSSPFWSVIRKFENSILGFNYASVWLNFNRFDQGGGKPSAENKAILAELDFLLLEELQLLKPDVIIFLTGPSYDNRLFDLLKGQAVSINNFDSRQLCGVETTLLGSKIYRTYHPNYLRRSGLEESVIEAISSAVKA